MEPCLEGDSSEEIKRDPEGRLLPTRSTHSTHYYEYLINKPTAYARIFSLERVDKKKHPRCHGAAMINLSLNKAKRGLLAREISLPFGNVSIVCAARRGRKGPMPKVTVRMFVMTMDETGHIF